MSRRLVWIYASICWTRSEMIHGEGFWIWHECSWMFDLAKAVAKAAGSAKQTKGHQRFWRNQRHLISKGWRNSRSRTNVDNQTQLKDHSSSHNGWHRPAETCDLEYKSMKTPCTYRDRRHNWWKDVGKESKLDFGTDGMVARFRRCNEHKSVLERMFCKSFRLVYLACRRHQLQITIWPGILHLLFKQIGKLKIWKLQYTSSLLYRVGNGLRVWGNIEDELCR